MRRISLLENYSKGDLATKLSFILMGSANFANKQWLKGIIFIVSQVGFIAWFIRNGFHALLMLQTLGTQNKGWSITKHLVLKSCKR